MGGGGSESKNSSGSVRAFSIAIAAYVMRREFERGLGEAAVCVLDREYKP